MLLACVSIYSALLFSHELLWQNIPWAEKGFNEAFLCSNSKEVCLALWQHHQITVTLKEAPQGPHYVTDVAEILSGSGHVPTMNATEKETGSIWVVNEHRKPSIMFPRAQISKDNSDWACASMYSWKWGAVRFCWNPWRTSHWLRRAGVSLRLKSEPSESISLWLREYLWSAETDCWLCVSQVKQL